MVLGSVLPVLGLIPLDTPHFDLGPPVTYFEVEVQMGLVDESCLQSSKGH